MPSVRQRLGRQPRLDVAAELALPPNAGGRPPGKSSGKSRTLAHEAFVGRAAATCPDVEVVGRYAGANTRLAVRCRACGYSWDAFPATILRSCSCPCCTNRVAVKGINDLATTHPDIAAEWDYERNGELKPTDVVAGSSKRVWWRCPEGHEWQAIIYRRKAGGGNCPVCGKVKGEGLGPSPSFLSIDCRPRPWPCRCGAGRP